MWIFFSFWFLEIISQKLEILKTENFVYQYYSEVFMPTRTTQKAILISYITLFLSSTYLNCTNNVLKKIRPHFKIILILHRVKSHLVSVESVKFLSSFFMIFLIFCTTHVHIDICMDVGFNINKILHIGVFWGIVKVDIFGIEVFQLIKHQS